jgi:hypothetical protein
MIKKLLTNHNYNNYNDDDDDDDDNEFHEWMNQFYYEKKNCLKILWFFDVGKWYDMKIFFCDFVQL